MLSQKAKNIIRYIMLYTLGLYLINLLPFLFRDLTSGYLSHSSELKTFILNLIDFIVGSLALFGLWKKMGWAPIALWIIFLQGVLSSLVWPPTYISGGFWQKLNNLPPEIFLGAVLLIIYYFANRQPRLKSNVTNASS